MPRAWWQTGKTQGEFRMLPSIGATHAWWVNGGSWNRRRHCHIFLGGAGYFDLATGYFHVIYLAARVTCHERALCLDIATGAGASECIVFLHQTCALLVFGSLSLSPSLSHRLLIFSNSQLMRFGNAHVWVYLPLDLGGHRKLPLLLKVRIGCCSPPMQSREDQTFIKVSRWDVPYGFLFEYYQVPLGVMMIRLRGNILFSRETWISPVNHMQGRVGSAHHTDCIASAVTE